MAKQLSDEEFVALETKGKRAEELEKENGELESKYKTVESEKAQLARELEEGVSIGVRELRKRNNQMREHLKSKGLEVDDDGNVIDGKPIKMDDVIAKAQEVARKEAMDSRREEIFSQIEDDDDRKVAEHYFDKLTQGEDVNMKNIAKYAGDAVRAAFPDQTKLNTMDYLSRGGGRGPARVERQVETALPDTQAEQLGNRMNLHFSTKKPIDPKSGI